MNKCAKDRDEWEMQQSSLVFLDKGSLIVNRSNCQVLEESIFPIIC